MSAIIGMAEAMPLSKTDCFVSWKSHSSNPTSKAGGDPGSRKERA
jgi:hypothetical protein